MSAPGGRIHMTTTKAMIRTGPQSRMICPGTSALSVPAPMLGFLASGGQGTAVERDTHRPFQHPACRMPLARKDDAVSREVAERRHDLPARLWWEQCDGGTASGEASAQRCEGKGRPKASQLRGAGTRTNNWSRKNRGFFIQHLGIASREHL